MTRCAYDPAGRRTRCASDRGSDDYTRDDFGWLSSVTHRDASGSATRAPVHVDALGELARVAKEAVFCDSADPWGGVLRAGGTDVVTAGPLTGLGGAWQSAWRPA